MFLQATQKQTFLGRLHNINQVDHAGETVNKPPCHFFQSIFQKVARHSADLDGALQCGVPMEAPKSHHK
jgi:hypothetical protein